MVAVYVLRHRLPLLFHEVIDLLLVRDLLHHSLELLLEVLDLVLLVAVLDTFVCNLLLCHYNLLIDWLLVLLPLILQLFELLVDSADFGLQDAHILTSELIQLRKHLLLFLQGLLHPAATI